MAQAISRKVSIVSRASNPVTSGLTIDFDFSDASTIVTVGNKLSQITDKISGIISSQATDALRPLWSNNGGIGNNSYASFTGTQTLTGALLQSSTDYTLFLVRKVTVSSGVNSAIFQNGTGSGNGYGWVDYQGGFGGTKLSGGYPATQAGIDCATPYNRYEVCIISHSAGSATQYNVSNFKFSPTGSTLDPSTPVTAHVIGNFNFVGINKGNFDIARLLLYNRKLTDNEVAQVNSFLVSRYSLQVPGQYIAGGDSITFGTGGLPNYPTEILLDLINTKNFFMRNTSLSGRNSQDIIANLTTEVINNFQVGLSNVYSLMIGRNGIGTIQTPAQVYADLQSIGASVRAAGFKYIIMTMLYTTNPAVSNTLVDTYNNLIRSDHSFADGFLDANQITQLIDPTNTTYYADGTHITSAGAQLIATAIEPIISALI